MWRIEKQMTEDRNAIAISVVLAAPDGGRCLNCCLEALEAQISPALGEIVVAHGPRIRPEDLWRSSAARIRWIPLPLDTEVPRLWKAGIEASTGKIIVLLVESCVPSPGWVDQILKSHESQTSVIGGAIDLDPALGLVDSAVYFCRYSRYMPPFTARYVDDLPGTNCSYPRASLEGVKDEMADGFWESFVHEKMKNQGGRLLCDPVIMVRYTGPTFGKPFLRARFAHGREFAARRAASLSRGQRALRAVTFPLVAVLMLRRVAVQVWTRRRYRTRFLTCSPLLMLFLTAWSTGECLGYLLGSARRTDGAEDQPSRELPEAS